MCFIAVSNPQCGERGSLTHLIQIGDSPAPDCPQRKALANGTLMGSFFSEQIATMGSLICTGTIVSVEARFNSLSPQSYSRLIYPPPRYLSLKGNFHTGLGSRCGLVAELLTCLKKLSRIKLIRRRRLHAWEKPLAYLCGRLWRSQLAKHLENQKQSLQQQELTSQDDDCTKKGNSWRNGGFVEIWTNLIEKWGLCPACLPKAGYEKGSI